MDTGKTIFLAIATFALVFLGILLAPYPWQGDDSTATAAALSEGPDGSGTQSGIATGKAPPLGVALESAAEFYDIAGSNIAEIARDPEAVANALDDFVAKLDTLDTALPESAAAEEPWKRELASALYAMSADHALHTLEWLRYAEEARIDEMVTPQNLLSTVGRTQSRARLETYRARFEEYIRVGDEKQAFHDNEVAAVTGGGAGAAALVSFKTRWAEAEQSMRAIEDRMVALEQQGITVVFALLDLLDERPDSLAYGMDCQCWAAGDRDTEAAFAGLTSELVAIGRSGEEINAEWAAAARENAQILRDAIPRI